MGKYDKYYDAEKYIIDMVKTEMIGPIAENEVLDSPPLNTYVAGILWARPLNDATSKTDDERDYEFNMALVDGQLISDDEECGVPVEIDFEEEDDGAIAKSALRKPSTMGMSLMFDRNVSQVQVRFSFGRYEHSEEMREYGENGEQRKYYLYTRKPHVITLQFDFSKEQTVYYPINEMELQEHHISIRATKRLGRLGAERLITFSVCNELQAQSKDIVLNESALFQCELSIEAYDGEFLPLDPGYSSIFDIEDEILAMQYRNVFDYAQGHGCAAEWVAENGVCREVHSVFIPVHEVKQMKPPAVEDSELFALDFLFDADRKVIVDRLNSFIDSYQNWADEEQRRGNSEEFTRYQRAVRDCIYKIRCCISRLREGVNVLAENDIAWRSFVLCNKAMYNQRINMALINGYISSAEEFKEKMDRPQWYPFQLFYLLMIIPDFTNQDSEYKDVVDLLWFPTGGGKTEAYLAVSSFIIFYERLSVSKPTYGTAIIMRYTLRLLTIQQFERATALICACEKIRQQESLGGNEISIGLWIGGGSAPNNIKDAEESLKKLCNGEPLYELSNPVQITKCPYCGKELSAVHYHINPALQTMDIVCESCGHLPIYIVDTDIYAKMPTLVVSTVDKFARIVWEERAGRIFGCNVSSSKPRLIIQDELHLISGPLGTLTGLYESAIDRLCWSDDGDKPKIIASTATVKNAAYQIKGLYGRKHFQFPPSGLDNTNSFFAVQATKDDKPSRFYVGLTETGGSMVDLMIRLFSVLCVSDYFLANTSSIDENVVDQYYTIIGYFNAIKDLGTAATVVKERMYSYIISLLNSKFLETSKELNLYDGEKKRVAYDVRMDFGELTSRRNSTEIKNILDNLKNKYNKDRSKNQAFKYVLSSNMFSVGVDINRLGLMAVYGQPKSNADYIQATSRVGRTNPGLVFCMYNAFRSRDRSYYERFNQYHACFYKYVESTSVTPFSMRSIEKGLHSVFIALVRHLVPDMANNDNAGRFSARDAKVQKIKQYLIERIQIIQSQSAREAKVYLEEFIGYWHTLASSNPLVYDRKRKGANARRYVSLLIPAEEGEGDFPILNSVRNVENSSNVFINLGEV